MDPMIHEDLRVIEEIALQSRGAFPSFPIQIAFHACPEYRIREIFHRKSDRGTAYCRAEREDAPAHIRFRGIRSVCQRFEHRALYGKKPVRFNPCLLAELTVVSEEQQRTLGCCEGFEGMCGI